MNFIGKDFRNFYKSLNPYGMSSFDSRMQVLDNMPADSYQNPYILEERQLNVTQMDVFSRLMMDRIIFVNGEVRQEMASIIVAQLLYLDSVDDRDINLYINSQGGSVIDGLSIVDTMNFVKSRVTTCAIGLAASMGSIILVSGEKGYRSALENSRVLIHQPLGGAQGQASDIEISCREILKCKDKLYKILSQGTGQSIEKITKDADRDYWMSSEEALEYGIIDKIQYKKS